jgi:hypothetical protein
LVNTNVETTDGQLEGFFSVMLTVENGSIHYTEGAGSVTATDKFPYAPLAVAHKPQLGKFPYGLVDNNDIVVWGTSHQEGRGQWGYTRAFQIPENYDPLVMSLSTVRMVNVSWTTTVRPTLSNDGYEMYAVGQSSQIAGWVGSPFSFQPSWMATLDADEVDPAARKFNRAIRTTLQDHTKTSPILFPQLFQMPPFYQWIQTVCSRFPRQTSSMPSMPSLGFYCGMLPLSRLPNVKRRCHPTTSVYTSWRQKLVPFER